MRDSAAMEALYNLYHAVAVSWPALDGYPVMEKAKQAIGDYDPEDVEDTDLIAKINALSDENDRLRNELKKANNEFGCETSEWPDLWRRIASLKEALRRSECGGWRPINTAPTDGRDLILTSSEWNGDVVIGSFAFGRWRDTPSPEAPVLHPTHWMPRRVLVSEEVPITPFFEAQYREQEAQEELRRLENEEMERHYAKHPHG